MFLHMGNSITSLLLNFNWYMILDSQLYHYISIIYISLLKYVIVISQMSNDPVGSGCRIHRLDLCREARLPQRVSWYDTK